MKDPKRYTLVQINDEHWMHENKNRMNAAPVGEYVLFDDYARLKAEVENANRINTELLVLSNRQASDIRRLTKAGDAMADCITEFRCGKYGNALNAIGGFKVWTDWNAAKDGKPSE